MQRLQWIFPDSVDCFAAVAAVLQFESWCEKGEKVNLYIYIYIIYIIYRPFLGGALSAQTTATLQQLQQIDGIQGQALLLCSEEGRGFDKRK